MSAWNYFDVSPEKLIDFAKDQTSMSNMLWVLLAISLLANLKNLPGMWHVRLISAVLYHISLRKDQVITTSKHGEGAVFQYVVTTSRSPAYECDINGHKSDSTYFTDLDINRIHLISLLFKGAGNPSLLPRRNMASNSPSPVKMRVLLGGTSCTFRREIKPYQAYEIHSRVISWDDKWMYIVSHFVRVGVLKAQKRHMEGDSEDRVFKLRSDAIFASAISKYVFKHGRKTVPPREALEMLQLLPSSSELAIGEATASGKGQLTKRQDQNSAGDQMELEKSRKLEIAQHFAALDDLHGLFASTESIKTFGKFSHLGEGIF